jgi:hypothetical protein
MTAVWLAIVTDRGRGGEVGEGYKFTKRKTNKKERKKERKGTIHMMTLK